LPELLAITWGDQKLDWAFSRPWIRRARGNPGPSRQNCWHRPNPCALVSPTGAAADVIRDLGQEFDVSTWVIEHQISNHGLVEPCPRR